MNVRTVRVPDPEPFDHLYSAAFRKGEGIARGGNKSVDEKILKIFDSFGVYQLLLFKGRVFHLQGSDHFIPGADAGFQAFTFTGRAEDIFLKLVDLVAFIRQIIGKRPDGMIPACDFVIQVFYAGIPVSDVCFKRFDFLFIHG